MSWADRRCATAPSRVVLAPCSQPLTFAQFGNGKRLSAPRQRSGGRIRVCSSPPHGESTSGECYTVTTASTTQRSISPLSCLIHPGISRLELLFLLHNLRTDLFLVGECSSRPMCLKSLGYLLACCCDQVGSSKAAGYVPGYLYVSYRAPTTG